MKQENGQNFLENSNLQKPPTNNEIELVVFGRGYGECIMLKYSDSDYMVIDSFINPDTKNPIAIDYLNALNIQAENIRKVVVTHWHGDHIAGISDIIKQSSKDVKIIINPIIKNDKFFDFISLSEKQKKESTKEFIKVFDYINDNGAKNVQYALNDRLLYEKDNIGIKALSPQDSEVWNYISDLNKKLFDSGVGYDIPDNNELSIALLLKYQEKGILLGSDLENGKNPNTCWKGIVDNYTDVKSDIFKIPHHGSVNAHNKDVWDAMLDSFPISILTTFNKSTKLPTEEDVKRILNLSRELYVVGAAAKRNREIERLAKKIITDISITVIPQTIGMVRYRYNLLTKQSKLESFGEVSQYINRCT